MNKYTRLCRTVNDRGALIPPEAVHEAISNPNVDYYTSVYYYNDDQYKQFKETGTVKGIKDVLTDKLVWDFDDKADPEHARFDAIALIKHLETYNISPDDLEITFSGNKGFNVVANLDRMVTPDEAFGLAVTAHGQGLKTLDATLYDAVQILRVVGTRNPKSGLFKIPLTYKQLVSLNTDKIKNLALDLDNITEEFNWKTVKPKESFFNIPKVAPVKPKTEYKLDLSSKNSQWKNCKWSLLQGNFKEGERHQALLVVAATARGLGADKDLTYYMCKSALKKQAALTGQEEFPKEELFKNIIEQSIFADGWEGGQYTCQKPGWLQDYCKSLGEHACPIEKEEPPVIHSEDMGKVFDDYATNFENNIIKTGIKGLDDNVMYLASTLNGLLGQPGSGKTSLSLQYLNNTSKEGIQSTFLSLDMGVPIIFAKMVQRMIGCSFKEAMRIFREDPKQKAELIARIKDEYKNVGFNFKSGLTVPDIKRIVTEQQEMTGNKTKLLVIDYLECLCGPFSDVTANHGFIANQLKDVANELQLCCLLLLQTQKHSTTEISDPILTMKAIKGSSVIEQSCSVVTTLWREGYSPKTVEDDRYMSFAAVKNRFGSLWSGDFSWDGTRGVVRGLTEEESSQLYDFRGRKAEARAKANELNGWK